MYDLHRLGWFGFQELCNSIAREILGQTSMTFLESADGGRDGCFTGNWQNTTGENYSGEFVIQCKFKTRQNENLKFGSTWINNQIRDNPNIRRLVPRVYGLGDLSEILDQRVYEQGKALLEYLKDELSKVVITSSFKNAANAIEKHNFVLLIGEAAAGKTTIASLLAMGSLDQWQAPTMKLETAEQVVHHWNPNNPMQFFWIDDAFGVTQYESTLSKRWNQAMPKIVAMLDKGAKIVMTSRDYIFNDAKKDLKKGAYPILHESQVVVDVQKLTLSEKRQILYNHLKMGKQHTKFKKDIKPFLEFISNHERFIPEMARRLSDPFFTKNLYLSEFYLDIFIQKQESFLIELISELDKDNRAALALIYMNKEKLKSPLELDEIESNAILKIGSSLSGCINALEVMKGNMVQNINVDDESLWKYKHPTIGDAFAKHIVESPDMIEIYLHGSSVDQLLDHITCGDMEIKNAIVIPKKLFNLILEKLNSYKSTKKYKTEFLSEWGAKRNLFNFLARRCSVNFLKIFIKDSPEILIQVSKPGINLDYSPEVNLALRLYSANLLPEENRKAFVSNVSAYALSGENLYIY